MSNIEQALKAALAAIDLYDYTMTVEESEKFAKAERLCKSALAELEKNEPVGWQFYQDGKWCNGMDTNNHKQNTVDAEFPVRDLYTSPQPIEKCEPVAKVLFIQDEDGLEPHTFYSNDEAPAQEQLKDKFVIMDVYLVPQPRAWIGLSENDITEIWNERSAVFSYTVQAIEAKLRELNTKG